MILQIVMFAAFLALSIVFSRGKGSFLIAGYNTMSKEEKAKYDEKKLLKHMSGMMLSCAVCMLIAIVGMLLGAVWLETAGYCLIIPCGIVFAILANIRTKK